jgi:hypothetical protein
MMLLHHSVARSISEVTVIRTTDPTRSESTESGRVVDDRKHGYT